MPGLQPSFRPDTARMRTRSAQFLIVMKMYYIPLRGSRVELQDLTSPGECNLRAQQCLILLHQIKYGWIMNAGGGCEMRETWSILKYFIREWA
jgi:hypothetical protein